MQPFELTCNRLGPYTVPLAPARRERAIFDRNRHAYRCLPLAMANTAGWELLCPIGFTAEWDGGQSVTALTVEFDSPVEGNFAFAKSHFSDGILTFETGWIFQTSGDYGLWVMGSPNEHKDGIAPLAGLVETDWLPYPFTMNWRFTRPGKVRFEKGEPFGFITPAPRMDAIADCQPREVAIVDNPELMHLNNAWREDREALTARLSAGDPAAHKTPWGRNYFQGQHPASTGAAPPERHTNKLRTQAPVRVGTLAGGESHQGRLDEAGRLTPSARTRTVRSAADAARFGLDFLVVDDLASAADCDALRAVYDTGGDLLETHHADAFWQARLLNYREVEGADTDAARLMRSTLAKGIAKAARFYQARGPLYADVLHLASWPEGKFMVEHADNAYPDGRPHPMAHRAYSGLLYLNDDFDGGGLYLPKQDVLIQPRQGLFVSLPATASHSHAVVRVERGRRYTMPFFLTFDSSKADPRITPPLAPLTFGDLGELTFAREDA